MRYSLVLLLLTGCVLPEQELASETEICLACAQTTCDAEIGACTADDACAASLTCVQGCPDDACIETCLADNPNGTMLITPVFDCAVARCSDDCSTLDVP